MSSEMIQKLLCTVSRFLMSKAGLAAVATPRKQLIHANQCLPNQAMSLTQKSSYR